MSTLPPLVLGGEQGLDILRGIFAVQSDFADNQANPQLDELERHS